MIPSSSERTWLSVCIAVVNKFLLHCWSVLRCYTGSQYSAVYGHPSSSTYRWPEPPSPSDVALICFDAIPEMPRRSGNVPYDCANKHRSCHRVWYRLSLSSGPLRFPACLPHSPLSSPAASGQRYHYATWQTVTLVHLWASNISTDDTQRCCIKSRLWSCFSHELCPISI